MANIKKEKRFKLLQELVDYLEVSPPIKEPLESFLDDLSQSDIINFNGTELDALKLIKRFGLKFENNSSRNYQSFKRLRLKNQNTYSVGPNSMYGHILYKFNIIGYCINITKNTKTNYNQNYISQRVNGLTKDDKYVILDIETTGLDPVIDDIIQICIYENENHYTLRYLPLEKRESNIAYKHNHIEDDLLQNQSPISQAEVDRLIEKFDLENKTVLIWTGKNYFDQMFLESYFYEHNLKGLEKIKFYNGADLLDLVNGYTGSRAKDEIAEIYQIDTTNAHNALNDCRIESEIIENLLNKNFTPFIPIINNTRYRRLMYEIWSFFFEKSDFTAEELYDKLCNELVIKNGKILEDYDKNPRTRGKEWIDIHHIDEKILDNIATRTNEAKKRGDFIELRMLAPFNKKERLVYATKVEHFLLHCILNFIDDCLSYGTHFLFGDLLKMEIGIFEEGSWLKKIQDIRNDKFYSLIDFGYVVKIYRKVLERQGEIPYILEDFYKLDTYKYDKEKYDSIMKDVGIYKK